MKDSLREDYFRPERPALEHVESGRDESRNAYFFPEQAPVGSRTRATKIVKGLNPLSEVPQPTCTKNGRGRTVIREKADISVSGYTGK